jgi:hypothetical protein
MDMQQNTRDLLQFLLYPLTWAVAGYVFNSHLDDTKKTEVMEKFIPRLTGDKPAESFLADRLIDKMLDNKTAQDIHRITRETWVRRLDKAVANGNAEDAGLIADTAIVYVGDTGRQILAELRNANSTVLTKYQDAVQSNSSEGGKLDPSRSPEPSQVPKQIVAAATIAPEIKQATQTSTAQVSQVLQNYWIYLGATSAGKWIAKGKTITEENAPADLKGHTITAGTDVFRRSDLPRYVNGEWKLGDILGVLPEQQHILVQDIRSVPGVNNTELWWAWVSSQ